MIISLQRIENLALAAVIAIAYIYFGFPWWSLLAMFLVFDLSALGYLHSPRSGALWYNLVHNYTSPALLGAVFLLFAFYATLVCILWVLWVSWDFLIPFDH